MKRGTIILTPFPFTDLTTNKVRPALIVSSNRRKGKDIIITFITTAIDLTNLSTTDLLIDSKRIILKKLDLKQLL